MPSVPSVKVPSWPHVCNLSEVKKGRISGLFYWELSFLFQGIRVLSICLPYARECGDLCTGTFNGEVLRLGCFCCLFTRGIAAAPRLTFFASPKESKQRKATAARRFEKCNL